MRGLIERLRGVERDIVQSPEAGGGPYYEPQGTEIAVFEATHGTAPKYANLDKVNPSSLMLSAVMMLDHLGWSEASALLLTAMEQTIGARVVTYDLARQMDGAKEVKTSQFAEAMVERM